MLFALLPALAWAGLWLNKLVASGSTGMAVGAVLLTLMVRQRRGWDKVLQDARKSASSGPDRQSENHYNAARRGAERLVFTFSETVVAGLTLFAAGGFAFFLPFRFLAALIARGAPEGAGRPSGPFYAAATFFYTLTSLPAAALSALALAMSPLILPGSRAGAVRGLAAPVTGRLPLRLWPLAVVAEGLTLAFDSGPAIKKGDGAPRWIGPKDGRARLNAIDIAQAGRMVLVAEALILLIIMMATSFFLTGGL
ncbi:hypothetical protein [Kordiimonas marina]|uniref:hypothetical protein n=1 Tax=Kordiimonas marina TaxID=2872312 RepID=UPI001FF6288C|nr:hypothetical protein [Kordiimonas marina]MCJ9428237.1 hypothetical protein [Kordiimonas marina]